MASHCLQCGQAKSDEGACPVCLMALGMSARSGGGQGSGRFILPEVAELGEYFPAFEIRSLIGQGGMGAVYRAHQRALERDVAIKLIHLEYSSDPTFLERFAREAKTLGKLSHPNIVTIYDFGQTPNGIAYFVMEYVDGINLREVIQNREVDPEESIEWIKSICNALEYAHAKGIVHRDIKPENILLGEDGVPKLADFGIAKIVSGSHAMTSLTLTRQVLGSPNYLAPEHLESPELIDHRVDIYSLGIVLYELLTGQLPLGRFESPRVLNPAVPVALDELVMKALQRRPALRQQSVAELKEELRAVSFAGQGVSKPILVPVTRSTCSVPFEWESENGLKWAVGIVRAVPHALRLEFKYRDPLFGKIKSKLRVVEIPVEQLEEVSIRHGIFSSKMTIVTNDAMALGDLPDSESGSVGIKIKLSDRERADQVLDALGMASSRERAHADLAVRRDPRHLVLGLLLMLTGIFNAGALAIAQVLNERISEGSTAVVIAIAASIILGPLATMQIGLGLAHTVLRLPGLAHAVCVLSMLPITPVWILSFPLGAWGLKVLSELQGMSPQESKKQAWGATTLMYLRENRTARYVSIANGIGVVVGFAGLTLFITGCYPVTMTYRIVSQDWNSESLEASLASRLSDLSSIRLRVPSKASSGVDRLTVSAWKFQRRAVVSRLQIAGALEWVALTDRDRLPSLEEQDKGVETWPLASTAEVPKAWVHGEGLGRRVRSVGATERLTGSMVRAIDKSVGGEAELMSSGSGFSIRLTAEGRGVLGRLQRAGGAMVGVGLIADGMVIAYAEAADIETDRVGFRYSGGSKLDAEAVFAAIRGPELVSELEPL